MAKKLTALCPTCIHKKNFKNGLAKTESGVNIGMIGEQCLELRWYFIIKNDNTPDYAFECEAYENGPVMNPIGLTHEVKKHDEAIMSCLNDQSKINNRLNDLEQTPVSTLEQVKEKPQSVYNISGNTEIYN